MKKLFILLLVFSLCSCDQKSKSVAIPTTHRNVDWLVGKWERLNEKEDKQTFEYWQKETPNTYTGHGFTMLKEDTIWQEKMTFTKKDTAWILQVKTPGNIDLVEFKLTALDSSSFIVENPSHDFPKKIKYWKKDENLLALVEADSMKIKFAFKPLDY